VYWLTLVTKRIFFSLTRIHAVTLAKQNSRRKFACHNRPLVAGLERYAWRPEFHLSSRCLCPGHRADLPLRAAIGAGRSRRPDLDQLDLYCRRPDLTGILAADAIRGIAKSEDPSLAPIFGLPVGILALLSLPLHVQAASLRLPAREIIMRPTAWLLLAWTIGLSAWSAVRFYQSEMPTASELAITPRPVLQAERQAIGVSDRGRPIALFRVHSPAESRSSGFHGTTSALARMAQTVIRRDGPNASSNCHGWVFAGGKYLLDGAEVPTLLEDNGYEPCRDPRPGDLIVYWSRGSVVHTGLVSGVLADGTVLIESKWNLQERFLHRPEDQPYSREFTFYRTSRATHQITIRHSATEALTGTRLGGESLGSHASSDP
jgi:hypothetical protein